MRELLRWSIAGLLVLTMPLTAAAHGDERLVEGHVEIPAGASATFRGDVHYHRLVGSFKASSPVEVALLDPVDGHAILTEGPAHDLTINELIRCCDDAAWTEYLLVISNPGDRPVEVSATATLVHDDLAVSVYRAEPGVVESMIVLGGLWAFAVWRRRRKGITSTRVATVAATIAVPGVAFALTLYGALRYGAGSAPGLLAGLADVPIVPFNPLVSRASLLLLVGMVGWAIAGARWATASHEMSRPVWIGLGALLAAMPITAAILVSSTYGTTGVAALTAALAVAPVAVVIGSELRQTLRSSAVSVADRTAASG